jgi:hypothetical protein
MRKDRRACRGYCRGLQHPLCPQHALLQSLSWALGISSKARQNVVDLADCQERFAYISGHTLVVQDPLTGQQTFLQVSWAVRVGGCGMGAWHQGMPGKGREVQGLHHHALA